MNNLPTHLLILAKSLNRDCNATAITAAIMKAKAFNYLRLQSIN